MTWSAAILLALLAAGDLRIPLVEMQIEQNHAAALGEVERTLSENPELAQALGYDYLRGHLLLQLGRQREAVDAFVEALSTAPQLSAYSRFRLAIEQEKLGHPEVAAGLVARLVDSDSPRALQGPAIKLLVRTLEQGGDCRLLGGLQISRFKAPQARQLLLAKARCAVRGGEAHQGRQILLQLLEENRRDDAARMAAHQLRSFEDRGTLRADLLIGLSFHNHREFDLAIEHLAHFITNVPSQGLSRREAFESRYALARSHFWQESFTQAAAHFGSLASQTNDAPHRAQALYQQARCFELLNSWDQASAIFQRVYQAEPRGRWADAAILSYMRLQWRMGYEEEALQALEALIADRHYSSAGRALIFLASSDLVQGRTDRATDWLTQAARIGKLEKELVAYWRGRLYELEGNVEKAVREYVRGILAAPYHPLSQAAIKRLEPLRLTQGAQQLARQLAASSRLEDLHSAWVLLGEDSALSDRVRNKLIQRLVADPLSAPYLQMITKPLTEWQLWRSPLRQPEEKLLALGLFGEGASAFGQHFPMSRPSLAYTGSLMLQQAGEFHRSLYQAEVLAKRIPSRVPTRLLPTSFRRLLYPMGYEELIATETRRHQVDPYFLAAVIREESRFKPEAFSGAAARGLTQFVFPTAQRIADQIGLQIDDPRQVEQPEVAIALGAAYLRELRDRFGGSLVQSIAAYNAGEPQSELWKSYCFSDEPEEYLSKVGFKETRNYLRKVLTSYYHYRELYGPKTSLASGDG